MNISEKEKSHTFSIELLAYLDSLVLLKGLQNERRSHFRGLPKMSLKVEL